jgi:hypothetical protein
MRIYGREMRDGLAQWRRRFAPPHTADSGTHGECWQEPSTSLGKIHQGGAFFRNRTVNANGCSTNILVWVVYIDRPRVLYKWMKCNMVGWSGETERWITPDPRKIMLGSSHISLVPVKTHTNYTPWVRIYSMFYLLWSISLTSKCWVAGTEWVLCFSMGDRSRETYIDSALTRNVRGRGRDLYPPRSPLTFHQEMKVAGELVCATHY